MFLLSTESKAESAAGFLHEPDSTLLSLIEKGDERALSVLFERHSRLVYGVALRVLSDPAAAEDVMQEIFLTVWRKPLKFQGERGDLRGWLTVVSRNRAIDTLRQRRPSALLEEMGLVSSSDVAGEAERHLLLEKIREALQSLPEEQRNALELSFFEGCTHEEIAKRLNHPLGTVKTRIRAALQTLVKSLRS